MSFNVSTLHCSNIFLLQKPLFKQKQSAYLWCIFLVHYNSDLFSYPFFLLSFYLIFIENHSCLRKLKSNKTQKMKQVWLVWSVLQRFLQLFLRFQSLLKLFDTHEQVHFVGIKSVHLAWHVLFSLRGISRYRSRLRNVIWFSIRKFVKFRKNSRRVLRFHPSNHF